MKLMLFDIDGTLLISRGASREAKARAMREVFGTEANVRSHPFGGKTDWQILREVLQPHGFSRATIGERMGEFQALMARYLEDIIRDYPISALPGAHDLLARLKQREDVLLGLITGNTQETAPIKLRAAGFDPADFVVGAFGSESDNRNDLPRIALHRANEHSGQAIASHATWVIGDTTLDIECARAIGAVAVAVLTGFEDPATLRAAQPDYLLDDLTHFWDVIPL